MRRVQCLLCALLPAAALADEAALARLLARDGPPPGVVLEIASRDPEALTRALPRVRDAAGRLRARFPALPMVVVSHGREMFALARSPSVQREAERLVRKEGIELHVCGTHAQWRGLAPEDFPVFVDVAAEGPAQIKNYVELGFVLIRIASH